MAKKLKWIPKRLKKGALHRDLGVAPDQPLPPAKVASAAKGNDKTAQRAKFALAMASIRAKRKMSKKAS